MSSASAATTLIPGLQPVWVASTLLLGTYGLILSERLNRAVVALLFAALTIVLGLNTQGEAVAAIDFNTIGLLIGMMIIVSITKRTGMFEFLAIWAVKRARAAPAGILAALQLVTAVISALLDNVTTVLLVVPVTFVICDHLRVRPYPFLVAQIFASNIGGTATLIGDPTSMLIGSGAGLSFNDFLFYQSPASLIITLVAILMFHLLYGRHFRVSDEARAKVMAFDEREAIVDRKLLGHCLIVLAVVIVAFLFSRAAGIEPATIALSGAAALMLLLDMGKQSEEQTRLTARCFEEIEWVTIFFFIGLFIVVHAVESTGVMDVLAGRVIELTRGNTLTTLVAILWSSALLSSVVDNVPFVATMIPLIKAMAPSLGGPQELMPMWWALSLGGCLGGNGTIIGASANLTVAGLAERSGQRFSFLEYAKVAFPVMLVTVAIANVYLVVRYF